MRLEDIEKQIGKIDTISIEVNNIVNKIVHTYTDDLDKLVKSIEKTLQEVQQGVVDSYPFKQLEIDFIQLTTLIYQVNSKVADLGGSSDIAKTKRAVAFSQAYLNSQGNTIKEKESLANIEIEADIIVEDIYLRAYKMIKQKTVDADNIHSALKKIYTTRVIELEVFRKEL